MKTNVVLIHDDRIYNKIIDEGDEISFGGGKKDDISVASFNPRQVVISYKRGKISLNAKEKYDYVNRDVPLESMIILDKTSTYLYFTNTVSESSKRLKIPYQGSYKLGRSFEDNDIIVNMPFVSSHHLRISIKNGDVRIEDQGSTNGTFLNGRRITVGKMVSGDVLSILSVNIRLLNGEMLFSGVGDYLVIRDLKQDLRSDSGALIGGTKQLTYHQSPRMQETLPSDDIILASAPTKGQKYEKSRGMMSVLAGTGAMAGASMLTGMMSPALLAARSASLISPIVNVSSTSKANKSRKKSVEEYSRKREEKYNAYIENQKARINAVAEVQKRILNVENPSPKEWMDILFGLKRSLWERMPGDRDFLDVRTGMGYDELCVSVRSRSNSSSVNVEDDELEELAEQIIEETKIVDNIPLRIPLAKYNSIGVTGGRSEILSMMRNMVVSLCTSHSFEDVRLICIFDEDEKEFWESLKWLPHTKNDSSQLRMLACTKDDSDSICDFLTELISQRKEEKKDHSKSDQVQLPHYVVIFASKDLVEKNTLMNHLFDASASYGVTSYFLFNDFYQLPPKCQYIIDLSDDPCAYEKGKVNERKYFTLDPVISDSDFDKYARRMSAIKYEGFATKSPLPQSVTFLEGYGVDIVEELDILSRWNRAEPYDSLAAPIGVLSGDQTFCLDIHEKRHGPHGLVAGTTGSGKSELLQTWILSMACCYHPYDVSFVLIDYKGGGMANLLTPLPHVVGTITNIDGNISRSIVSLESEVHKRERLFSDYDVNHIDKYQKLYKQGIAKTPMPHLVIVVDEFAELKKDKPDFMSGLIRVSRVGRSLGIHLILATQKPGGIVDDQISSNSRFRLCLKVQDAADSREMIKQPDAARIYQSGRAFIRVGEDEYFDLFQSYWSGAPYFGGSKSSADDENQVRVIDMMGRDLKVLGDKKKVKSDIDELNAIVKHIVKTATDSGIEALQGPWLPELPLNISLNKTMELYSDHQVDWLQIPVGIFDVPFQQAQGLMSIDLIADGNLAIYGAPGTGKSTLLKTLITSACMKYTPQQVVIYALDCGGWGLGAFKNMPNVGDIALDCEDAKVNKTELLITEILNDRKKLFVSNGVSSLKSYRENVDPSLPAVLLIIDNIASLLELYPDLENFLIKTASEGSSFGVYLIYTSNSTSGVRFKIVQNMKNAISLEMTDKSDYSLIVGKPSGGVPCSTGRALMRGTPPVEFQVAQPADGDTEHERNANIKALIDSLNSSWTGIRPDPIPVMPDIVSTEMMLERTIVPSRIPVGIDAAEVKPLFCDMSEAYCMLITGDSLKGKSRLLCDISKNIISKFDDVSLYVIDSDRNSLKSLQGKSEMYTVDTDDSAVTAVFDKVFDELNSRISAKNNGEENFPWLLLAIDDLKHFADSLSDDNGVRAERLCRLAKGLNIMILAAGRSDDIAKYNEIELITRSFINHQNGISLSGSPNRHLFFKNDLKYNEKNNESEAGYAYRYIDGKCRLFKFMCNGA